MTVLMGSPTIIPVSLVKKPFDQALIPCPYGSPKGQGLPSDGQSKSPSGGGHCV